MQSITSLYNTVITFLFLGFMGYSLLDYYNDLPLEVNQNSIYLTTSSGDHKSFMKSLKQSSIQLNLVDELLLYFIAPPEEGWYDIVPQKHERLDFFFSFHKHRSRTMNIVVFGGDTNDEIFEKISNDMNLDKNKLMAAYRKHSEFVEGGILAGGYTVSQNIGEEDLIEYLIAQSRKDLEVFAKEQFGKRYTKKQLHDALIIASIIHKETYKTKEMGTIASVIQNRLQKKMKLQMDGTLCYGKYSHQKVTPQRIKNDTSRFNTYKHYGLPPHPLCAVSIESLYAATFPKESDYLYFMKNKKGHHDFATTFNQHRTNIEKYKKRVASEKAIASKQKGGSKKIAEFNPLGDISFDIPSEGNEKGNSPVKINIELPDNHNESQKESLNILKF